MTIQETVKKYSNSFWKKVDKSGDCWLWLGGKNEKGYGRYGIYGGTAIFAHRFALIDSGVEIPNGMVVDHRCRNRSCVNPNHLRVVTIRQNSMENTLNPVAKNPLKTTCPRGHKYDRFYKSGRKCSECMRIREKTRKPRSWKKGFNYGRTVS